VERKREATASHVRAVRTEEKKTLNQAKAKEFPPSEHQWSVKKGKREGQFTNVSGELNGSPGCDPKKRRGQKLPLSQRRES